MKQNRKIYNLTQNLVPQNSASTCDLWSVFHGSDLPACIA